MPAHVLVTGAAGLIGAAVLDLLASDGVTATALVLEPPGEPAEINAERVLVGEAQDVALVDDALDDCDAVIHLAAIPHPGRDPDEVVFGRNTLATFTVLDRAARRGVRNAVIASSYAIGGLPFARRPLRMPYLPIDTGLPLQITDPYALSKRTDEATADMIHRQYGTTVVALRLPFVGGAEDRLAPMAEVFARDPGRGAADVWSYLDVRDAARALVLGLQPALTGNHVLYVAAPETLAPQTTEWLLDEFHPTVPRPDFPGRTVPIDLRPARELLGFTAAYEFPVA
ncbi:NAD(P)-dependent oxidoreductase [Actinoplanes sp. Pm04-4]|uniref:NAD(P)-dependent oxidoreductase n=1 Tax=Paractinoplanes pyxinae TaxID=2997416 RepID=A0ABT4B6N0_9ACTN|nr:NAD(P)-dependent oxidoreductase [Actinoplanes pyxinae]MCY1142158.1 NAD(P)-dependent oxidoreductase [Actinoplanes pyxinae]